MIFDLSDVEFEIKRGTGPGGQKRNKTSSCVRATHRPTGLSVQIDSRSQRQNKADAIEALKALILGVKAEKKAEEKKARRDHAIHNETTVRTYDFKKGIVKDHRSGKTASLKDVLVKGRIDLLHE